MGRLAASRHAAARMSGPCRETATPPAFTVARDFGWQGSAKQSRGYQLGCARNLIPILTTFAFSVPSAVNHFTVTFLASITPIGTPSVFPRHEDRTPIPRAEETRKAPRCQKHLLTKRSQPRRPPAPSKPAFTSSKTRNSALTAPRGKRTIEPKRSQRNHRCSVLVESSSSRSIPSHIRAMPLSPKTMTFSG